MSMHVEDVLKGFIVNMVYIGKMKKTISIAMYVFLLVIILMTVEAGNNLTNGLISTWEFDSTIEDSHGNNNGGWSGTNYVPGILNNSAGFNNSAAGMLVQHNETLNFGTNSWTMSFWLKAPMMDAGLVCKSASHCAGGGTPCWCLQSEDTAPDAGFDFWREDGDSNSAVDWAGVTYSSNSWTHYVFIINQSDDTIVLYQNNVSLGAQSIANEGGSVDNSAILYIGIRNGWNDWDGGLDQLNIWNRSLNRTEISFLYNSSLGVFYPFLEGGSTEEQSEVSTVTLNHTMVDGTNLTDETELSITYNGTITGSINDIFDCTLFNTTGNNPLVTNFGVNVSNLLNFTYNITNVEGVYELYIHCSKEDNLTMTNFTVITGTLDNGNITNMEYLDDGYNVSISEVTGTPGYELYFNFTNVTDFDEIHLNYWYEGLVSHNVEIQLWNFTDSSMDVIGILPEVDELTSIEFYVNDTNDDYINLNMVHGKIIHDSAGNQNHDIFIDYFKLALSNINTTTEQYTYTLTVTAVDTSSNDTYLSELNISVNEIESDVEEIKEAIVMIPILMFYIFLMVSSYVLVTKGNILASILPYVASLGFDFYFIYYYYTNFYTNVVSQSWQSMFNWLFVMTFVIWLLLKVAMPFVMKVRNRLVVVPR